MLPNPNTVAHVLLRLPFNLSWDELERSFGRTAASSFLLEILPSKKIPVLVVAPPILGVIPLFQMIAMVLTFFFLFFFHRKTLSLGTPSGSRQTGPEAQRRPFFFVNDMNDFSFLLKRPMEACVTESLTVVSYGIG